MVDPQGAPARPKAKDGLELVEAPDGLVVYDEGTDRVHHLNQTAAVILRLCDGTATVEEITDIFGRMFGVDRAPDDVIRECLSQLMDQQLVH
jgi:hypothetical protein